MIKSSVTFVLSSVLLLAVTTVISQAYYLDTPHNESNGILCGHCHYGVDFGDKSDPDPDITPANIVCLRCHDAASVNPLKGPPKVLHASTTTSTDLGNWSTECISCHGPHFQGQLDWAAEPALLLAWGRYDPVVLPMTYSEFDGPHDGSTTFGASGVDGVSAPWNAPTTWVSKGGNIDKRYPRG